MLLKMKYFLKSVLGSTSSGCPLASALVLSLLLTPFSAIAQPLDVSQYVTVTAANERSTMDRRTRLITSTADVTITNSSDQTISAPLHAVIEILDTAYSNVSMPDALGGAGEGPYGKFYYDLSSMLQAGDLLPGQSVTLRVTFVRFYTIRFRYNVIAYGSLDAGPVNQPPTADAGGPYSSLVGQEIIFDGSQSSDPNDDLLNCTWDFGDGSPPVNSVSAGHTYFAAGDFMVRLTVDDGRGGSDTAILTVTITVQNILPTADAGPDATYTMPFDQTSMDVTIDGGESEDADGTIAQYIWTGDPDPADQVAPTLTLSEGTYTFTLIVIDNHDAQSDPDTVDITVNPAPNRPPVADAGGPYAAEINQSIQFDGSGSFDPDGDSLTYAWDFDHDSTDTGIEPTHTFDEPGSYTVTLTVHDGQGGMATATATAAISADNQTPVFAALDPQTIKENEPLELEILATDPDLDPLTYAAVDLPDGADFNPDSLMFRWTPTFDQQGEYQLTFSVTDGQNRVEMTVAVTVTNVNRLPLAVIDGPNSSGTAQTIELNGTGSSDPDNNLLTYSWTLSAKPSDSAVAIPSPAADTISFVPDWIGTYEVQLIVNDGTADSSAATHTVDVTGTRPPIFTSSPQEVAQVGEAYTYEVDAQDPDGGDVLIFALEAAPDGMTIDPATGAIDWTPADNQSGAHQVVVRVADTAGLFARQDFILTVSAAGECAAGEINVCGRCAPFTPVYGQMNSPASVAEKRSIESQMSSLSVPFVANRGQTDEEVSYLADTRAGMVYVTRQGELVYSLSAPEAGPEKSQNQSGWTLTETLVGGTPRVAGQQISAAKVSYFEGRDLRHWRKDVPTYAEVSLGEVWPGITMRLKARNDSIEKLFTIRPGAEAGAIRLRLAGADRLDLSEDGALQVRTGLGDVTLTRPVAWQEKGGRSEPIQVAYAVRGNEYGFALGNYDPAFPVVIDPLLQSTYLGGNAGQWGLDIAVHPFTHEVYVAGWTESPDFPGTEGGAQASMSPDSPNRDFFVARLSEDLTTLLQATYIGGNSQEGDDYDRIAIHPDSGDVYIAGITYSNDFPGTTEGAQPGLGGSTDVVIVHLNRELTELHQATYLGGSSSEIRAGAYAGTFNFLIHPASGDIYAAGNTWSADFPGTTGSLQPELKGAVTGFVARLSPDLKTLKQSTYIGGSVADNVAAIVIHPATGDVIVGGNTDSADFPGTVGGAQAEMIGEQDHFVACLSEDLTELFQSTYLGSPEEIAASESLHALTVHPFTGDLYAAGSTSSYDFPGSDGGALPPHEYVGLTGFAARIKPSLAELKQTTYLTGPIGGTTVVALAIHPASGDVYAAGETPFDFPGTENGVQPGPCNFGGGDAFIARLSEDLTVLHQATFLGGTHDDTIRGMDIHPLSGDIYVAGITLSADFPGTSGGADSTAGSGVSAFAARLTADLYDAGNEINEPPQIISDPDTEAFEGQPYSYQVEADDPNPNDCLWFLLEEKPYAIYPMTIDNRTGLITWQPGSGNIGANTVVVSVTDARGLQDFQTFEITVQWTPSPPSIYSDPVTTAVVEQPYYYQVGAWDVIDGDALTYSLDTAPDGLSIDEYGRIRWTPAEADLGDHAIEIRVTDQSGLFDTQQFTLTVKQPNRQPAITSSPVTGAVVGQSYLYAVVAEDPDPSDVLTYDFVQRAVGMTIDATTGLIEWTPTPEQEGQVDIVVFVKDSGYPLRSTTQSYTITVSIGNLPPEITSIPVTTASEDTLYTYDVEASDPNAGDTLTYLLDAAPNGMTIDAATGLIQWTPNDHQVGDHTVTVVVHDSESLYISQTFIVNVANAEDSPTITSDPVKTTVEGEMYSYDVEAYDPDLGDILTFSLESAPDEMTINSSSGLIEWVSGTVMVGYHQVIIRVQDQIGLYDTQSFKVTVVAANGPPVITSSPPTTATEVMPYSYDVEATDPDILNALYFLLVAGPDSMTIDKGTGLVEWVPSHHDSGAHTAIVGVTDSRGLSDTQEFTITVADVPATTVRVEAIPRTLTIPHEGSNSISYVMAFETPDPGDYTIEYAQTISPDNGGLILKYDSTSQWQATESRKWLKQQVVTGAAVGAYEVTTTATIIETGATGQLFTLVNVIAGLPRLYPTGSYPDAISIGEPNDVLFTTMQSDNDLRPTRIVVEEIDESGNTIRELGNLLDDGTAGDLMADDYVYSGSYSISSNAEGILRFRAKAIFPEVSEPVLAEAFNLPVTRFPTGYAPGDMTKVVSDAFTGKKMVSDEVIVSFVQGTSPEVIEAIVNSIDGTVVGTLLQCQFYQVRIPDDGAASGVYQAIELLDANAEVRTIEPSNVGALAAIVRPTVGVCPQEGFELGEVLAGQEDEITLPTRLPEAWTIARGDDVLIAFIDTGVDYDHPDLFNKFEGGINFLEDEDSAYRYSPWDEVGHGTLAAGIAAAETDNALGIAGVAWHSGILAYKVADSEQIHGPAMAAAIIAAALSGSKIINVSLVAPDDQLLLSSVILASRHGALVVAAAGNDDSLEGGFAKYEEVLAVGGISKDQENEWVQWSMGHDASNFGEWVDLAAPASIGYSTFPTYTNISGMYYDFNLECPPGQRDSLGCYRLWGGTSMTAAIASGIAALVQSRWPGLPRSLLRDRLETSAIPLPEELRMGEHGRIDAFKAVFNGSFESGPLVPNVIQDEFDTVWGSGPQGWIVPGIDGGWYLRPDYQTDFLRDKEYGWLLFGYENNWFDGFQDSVLYGEGGGFLGEFGPLEPIHGDRMFFITTGREGETHARITSPEWRWRPSLYAAFLEQRFYIQPGQSDLYISLWYDFVTEEPILGAHNTDGFQISVELDGAAPLYERVHVLAEGRLHHSSNLESRLIPMESDPLLKDGAPMYHTQWQPITGKRIPLPENIVQDGGMATMRFGVYDKDNAGLGSTYYDSALLIDAIEFKSWPDYNFPPIASFIFTAPALAGRAVNFDAGSSYDSDGTIEHFEWDFDGDGEFDATGVEADFTYLEAGTYTVRLRVTDDDGGSDETTQTIEVGYELTIVKSGGGEGTVTSSPPGVNCGPDCSGAYGEGSLVVLTATPAIGSVFSGWSGDCTGTDLETDVTMDEHKICTATFFPVAGAPELTLVSQGTGNGTVTSEPPGIDCAFEGGSTIPDPCSAPFNWEDQVSLVPLADDGFSFSHWTGCDTDLGTDGCTVDMTGDRIVEVYFE